MISNTVLAALDRLGVSRESMERLEILVGVLLAWQARINLIAPSTVEDVWMRHVVDSAQLLPLIHKNTSAIADLGSGAGFPALVLAAIHPARVHMFEANAKKVAFLHARFERGRIGRNVADGHFVAFGREIDAEKRRLRGRRRFRRRDGGGDRFIDRAILGQIGFRGR